MLSHFSFRNRIPLLLACALLLVLFSCESKDKYAGTYKAESRVTPKQAEIVIELKGNGDGLWRVEGEEVAFTWYIKRGELRVNTKGGGVIVGKLEKDAIHMTLPNMKTMTLKKVQ